MCPVLALSCRADGADQCPKLGIERTLRRGAATAESETHLCHSTTKFAALHGSIIGKRRGRVRLPSRGAEAMKRRAFISLLGGAVAAWPLAARGQQPTMPVIGYLNAPVPEGYANPLRAFRQGLKESGFVGGENVAIDYRWGENQPARLPARAAELVRQRVNVIAVSSNTAAIATVKATARIPIVFIVADDPVKLGLVTSLAGPGGNATGINFFAAEL